LISLKVYSRDYSLSILLFNSKEKLPKWYWILIGIIPIVGFFVLIYFYVQKSAATANEFGDVPADAEIAQITQ